MPVSSLVGSIHEAIRHRRHEEELRLRVRTPGDTSEYVAVGDEPLTALPLSGTPPPVCCVVVGDDTQAKVDFLTRFLGGPSPRPDTALEIAVTRVQVGTPMRIIVPPTGVEHAGIRADLMQAAQVIVIVFSVKDRPSFEAVLGKWQREMGEATSHLHTRPPVVLVGAEAECRQLAGADLIDPKDAVRCAQKIKAQKYVEIHSGSEGHVREMFLQALRVAAPHNEPLTYCARVAVDASLFCPPPEGGFDLQRRGFQIERITDPALTRVVLATADGTDPRTSSTAFEVPPDGFVSLGLVEKRMRDVIKGVRPSRILLTSKARGMYASPVVEVLLPQQLPQPAGYFNLVTKSLVVLPPSMPLDSDSSVDGQPTLRFTTDGTEPSIHSRPYYQPIRLDDSDAYEVGEGASSAMTPYFIDRHAVASRAPPKEIKVAAFARGWFPSATTVFNPPPIIPTPIVHYAANTSTLTIEAPSPLYDYRYTLDGSLPTDSSLLYSRPVIVSIDEPEGGVKEIRVAAFPRPYFPSTEVRVDVRALAPTHRSGPHIISTTRSATARSDVVHRSIHARNERDEELNDQLLAGGGGPPSRTNCDRLSRTGPVPNTPLRSKATPLRGASPKQSPSRSRMITDAHTTTPKSANVPKRVPIDRGQANPDVHRETTSSRLRKAQVQPQSAPTTPKRTTTPAKKRPEVAPTPTPTTDTPPPPSPSCTSDDNRVVFEFPVPIELSHITVSTPGHGKGPDSYEVLVLPSTGGHTDPISVGLGDLNDTRSIQTMQVVNSARGMPLGRVVCKMFGPPGFEVLDMKVHGKPFDVPQL